MPRIDAGSFVPPTNNRDTKLRWYFWQAIKRNAPEVLASLRGEVYPHYRKAARYNRRLGQLPLASALSRPGIALRLDKCPEPLRVALDCWLATYRFSDPWIAEDALALMANWAGPGGEQGDAGLSLRVEPDLRSTQLLGPDTATRLAVSRSRSMVGRSLKWRSDAYLQGNPELLIEDALSVDVEFRADGWNPLEEDRETYRARIEQQFASLLTIHLDALEAMYESIGMQATSQRPKLEQHLDWLARYLFREGNYAEIAEHVNASETAVGDAVRQLVRELRLTFRPRRGRKPGSKNKSR